MTELQIQTKVNPYVIRLLDYYKSKNVEVKELKTTNCHNFEFTYTPTNVVLTISAHNIYGYSRLARLKDDKNELIIDDEYYVLTYMRMIINKFLKI